MGAAQVSPHCFLTACRMCSAFLRISPEKKSCNVFIKAHGLWAPKQEAAQAIRLLAPSPEPAFRVSDMIVNGQTTGPEKPRSLSCPSSLHTPTIPFLCSFPWNPIHHFFHRYPEAARSPLTENRAENWPADIPSKNHKAMELSSCCSSTKNTVPCLIHYPSETFTLAHYF